MDKKFVYPATEHQEMYRKVTSKVDLTTPYGDPLYFDLDDSNIPDDMVYFRYGKPKFNHEKIELLKSNGGINICNWNFFCTGKSSGGRRLTPMGDWGGHFGPTAFEPLAYGIGAYRELATQQETTFQAVTGESPKPKVFSEHEKVFLRSLLDFDIDQEDCELRPWIRQRKVYESTNYIYGDSYGELEQLIRRRKDTGFVQKYLEQLKEVTEPDTIEEIRSTGVQIARGMANDLGDPEYKLKWWEEHINQGNTLWDVVPKTTSKLLERAEYLLENTFVDHDARYVTTAWTPICEPMFNDGDEKPEKNENEWLTDGNGNPLNNDNWRK